MWSLSSNSLRHEDLAPQESQFALANGYLGVRGCFEEGYAEGIPSIRGTYLNAFHDIVEMNHGEKLYAFPDTAQKLLNIIDAQGIRIFLGGDSEAFSLFTGEVLSYERRLFLDKGCSEREIHWRRDSREIKLKFHRLVSFAHRELFAVNIEIEPVNYFGDARVVSVINGDVSNFVDKTDPRLGAGHGKLLTVTAAEAGHGCGLVSCETKVSGLSAACVGSIEADCPFEREIKASSNLVETGIKFKLERKVTVNCRFAFTDTLRHGAEPQSEAVCLLREYEQIAFSELLLEQKRFLDAFWSAADIKITGDETLQLGMRFNLFHLLQSAGRDKFSHIAAKGLTGEGYEGHFFWDTEIFMSPVFLFTKPDIAKSLLLFRCNTLDAARRRATQMGHKKGALFPWRTINGDECSAYIAGWSEYHISADIAYCAAQYYLATDDLDFLAEHSAELLFETARLWADMGCWRNGLFNINSVSGPNEYTFFSDNNYFTNVMAKHNLYWAAKAHDILAERCPETLAALCWRLGIDGSEPAEWAHMAEKMYKPYDAALQINAQDDGFLYKQTWDFDNTPKENYPLLLHYSPLFINRYQVCKQPDTMLAHFLLEDEEDIETVRRSYEYYEKITTHDSSLSYCTFSALAARLGDLRKAAGYFSKTSLLDINNAHGNTKDGLHLANMGGAWIAVVQGFGGARLKESGLWLSPALPEDWNGYAFNIVYSGRRLEIAVDKEKTMFSLLSGDCIEVNLYGEKTVITADLPVTVTRPAPDGQGLRELPRHARRGAGFNGVLFDLDGVITDTAEFHYRAWERFALEFGFSIDRELNERLKGISRLESLELVLQYGKISASEEEKSLMADRKNGYYLELVAQMSRKDILPGIEELIAFLKRKDILLAVASASKNAPLILDKLGLSQSFNYVVNAAEIRRSKPNPETFIKAAEGIGLPCSQCVGVEDAVAGIAAIKAAGMFAVGVGDGKALQNADAVVSSCGMLLPFFQGYCSR